LNARPHARGPAFEEIAGRGSEKIDLSQASSVRLNRSLFELISRRPGKARVVVRNVGVEHGTDCADEWPHSLGDTDLVADALDHSIIRKRIERGQLGSKAIRTAVVRRTLFGQVHMQIAHHRAEADPPPSMHIRAQ
jgi:hypothetical protein